MNFTTCLPGTQNRKTPSKSIIYIHLPSTHQQKHIPKTSPKHPPFHLPLLHSSPVLVTDSHCNHHGQSFHESCHGQARRNGYCERTKPSPRGEGAGPTGCPLACFGEVHPRLYMKSVSLTLSVSFTTKWHLASTLSKCFRNLKFEEWITIGGYLTQESWETIATSNQPKARRCRTISQHPGDFTAELTSNSFATKHFWLGRCEQHQ